jgi:hypothetical protein
LYGVLPFRFKVVRPDPATEIVYTPKLSAEDTTRLVSNLMEMGYSPPKIMNSRPRVLRLSKGATSLKLMPRGLLVGPHGLFDRIGARLTIRLDTADSGSGPLSWTENDYQKIQPSDVDLLLQVKGRYCPSVRRFRSVISSAGSVLAADEALMIAATVELAEPESVELLSSLPSSCKDLSEPIRVPGGGFMHHVALPARDFIQETGRVLDQALIGRCPISPLPEGSVILRRAKRGKFRAGRLDDVAKSLAGWVSDRDYFRAGAGGY